MIGLGCLLGYRGSASSDRLTTSNDSADRLRCIDSVGRSFRQGREGSSGGPLCPLEAAPGAVASRAFAEPDR